MDGDLMVPRDEWERCRPWVLAALAICPFYNIEDVERELEAGNLTFWPGANAMALTEILTYPNGKALNIFAVGGVSQQAIAELVAVFEPAMVEWANFNDCRWVMGHGRPGWERHGSNHGYEKLWSVMYKELKE